MKQILDWNAYLNTAAQTVAEGIVMLKNENHVLPLNLRDEIAVFGRMQLHYYKSGTGSGGMVNVHRVVSILDGLTEAGVPINKQLLKIYQEWDTEHPESKANGWGSEAWSQDEMPLTDEIAENAAKTSKTAICIIGRTAGEEQDNFDGEGSYRLTKVEREMLQTVRRHFDRTVVLLNVGNIIDMTDIESARPDAILYVWQGGMTGGIGTASVLIGNVSPSGKLPDTIAASLADYPSDAHFGNPKRNFYVEDIYIGYRYFETFASQTVRYPFGFGLSYTTFSIEKVRAELAVGIVTIEIKVTNTGDFSGKEVVQVYCEAPQGKLGKPARVLCGFQKTKCLSPNESVIVTISFDLDVIASFDDAGATDFPFCEILEKGDYHFYVGEDVRSAKDFFMVNVFEDMPRRIYRSAMAPVLPFDRIKPRVTENGITQTYEPVPQMQYDEAQRRIDRLPAEIPYTGNKGIKLVDVREKRASMRDFIAQLSVDDLLCIVRGEGMGTPKVTAGTAAAFGGITDALAAFGIPCACCDDGPSGLRLDSGTKAFSLPIGTLLAATFNPTLVRELFGFTGLEMRTNNVDVLLGPGMNIHRHPRNGRNFEYFSEDPLLTGKMGAAVLLGLKDSDTSGTIKHFCGNNQETNRHFCDNNISERALREIYLRGFEIAVREGGADSIMTTYGGVNGQWTAGSYDLNTLILRDEWGFSGFTMSDWWANINQRGGSPNHENLAAMVRAQNDIYMVCANTTKEQGNLRESLDNGSLTIGELQRNAANLCAFLMHSPAMDRLLGKAEIPEIINQPADIEDPHLPIVYYDVETEFSLPISSLCMEDGKRNVFSLCLKNLGAYEVSATAESASESGLSLIVLGSHAASFAWDKQEGKCTKSKKILLFSNYTIMRLYLHGNLSLSDLKFTFLYPINPQDCADS